MADGHGIDSRVPWFGARKLARSLIGKFQEVQRDNARVREHLARLGALTVVELEAKRAELNQELNTVSARIEQQWVMQATVQDRGRLRRHRWLVRGS